MVYVKTILITYKRNVLSVNDLRKLHRDDCSILLRQVARDAAYTR